MNDYKLNTKYKDILAEILRKKCQEFQENITLTNIGNSI